MVKLLPAVYLSTASALFKALWVSFWMDVSLRSWSCTETWMRVSSLFISCSKYRCLSSILSSLLTLPGITALLWVATYSLTEWFTEVSLWRKVLRVKLLLLKEDWLISLRFKYFLGECSLSRLRKVDAKAVPGLLCCLLEILVLSWFIKLEFSIGLLLLSRLL